MHSMHIIDNNPPTPGKLSVLAVTVLSTWLVEQVWRQGSQAATEEALHVSTHPARLVAGKKK